MTLPNTAAGTTLETLQRSGAAALQHSSSPMIDARVLLKFVLEIDDAEFVSRGDKAVDASEIDEFEKLIARRAAGEPVAYITGKKEFWSLPFDVTPDVLIPRDDSEAIIECVVARRNRSASYRILDLGVGSGCLLCALLFEFSQSAGVGVDRSKRALEIAAANAKALGLDQRTQFVVGDWLDPVDGTYDIIVANPPYIPEAERGGLMRDVAEFEPAGALFSAGDGLGAYEMILDGLLNARDILARDGLIVFETGDKQAGALNAMVKARFPYCETTRIRDLKGLERGLAADFRQCEKRD